MDKKNLFKMIPKVDDILDDDRINKLQDQIPRKLLVDSIREEIDALRKDIRDNTMDEEEVIRRNQILVDLILKRAEKKNAYKLRRVVNGTGVIIHTNLGRSLIDRQVMEHVFDVAINYSNLEFDLDKGERGSRYSHLKDIITEITGAEDAMVVNNNAAAVMLVLSTMAKDREVIVSIGELIEIGGSFRIPEVMEQSGATLKAVGTTNKTHLHDYERAINENTAGLMKVHTSNYRILGFTSSVSIDELFTLKEKYNLPLIEDLGSGVLVDLSKFGLEYEPTVQDSIKKGVDVVTFSGDKLLGGPQAGIIVGKKEYIDKMKKNPLTRAFRVDKFTIAALEATLSLYLDEQAAIERIPTLNMISMSLDELNYKAQRLYDGLINSIKDNSCSFKIVDDYSEVGGGSLPLERIPTKAIKISLDGVSINQFEKALREYDIPIISRIYKDNIFIDLRTVREDEFQIIIDGIQFGLNRLKGCI
ncbi:MAG: L-seryl-tRNA(Sec) selenium transferase [Tissierellia bacterium]|nr:L-seryl-tRNA(Sec) selenium transferase [Tissierellia bacterium]